jgi:4-alpha-glucanotransferase
LKLKRDDEESAVDLYKSSFGEKEKFLKYLYGKKTGNIKASPLFQKKCLEVIGKSVSIFSIQLIQEYLFSDKKLFDRMNKKDYRINTPGVIFGNNWSVRIPLSLDELVSPRYKNLNKEISGINKHSGRI